MKAKELDTLKPGAIYKVRLSKGRTVRRVFKWKETRFGSIACAVFSSRLQGPLQVEVLSKEHFRFTGATVPRGEISVPHYDLVSVTP